MRTAFLALRLVCKKNMLLEEYLAKGITTKPWMQGEQITDTNQVATYTGDGSQLVWKEKETGSLPIYAPRAVVIDNHIYVTGGQNGPQVGSYRTGVLRWDSSSESWQQAGNLRVARSWHAAVAIPVSIIESECS